MKLKFVNSDLSTKVKCYTKDKRALIVAQRTCDDEVLDYVSARDSEDCSDEGLG